MELRQLRYFLTLAKYRHFGRAAEAVHITQPTLSQQIRTLENDLGTPLFERSKRHVDLTIDGEALLPYARRMLALAKDARAELDDRSNLRRGRIRLGVTLTLGGHLLPQLLRSFHQTYSGLELTITEDGSDRLARELGEGRFDLALLVEPPNFDGKAFESLLVEEIVVALPNDHPLSHRKAVHLRDLREDPFILCREGYHLRGLTLEACHLVGFTPQVTASGTDVDTALRFVQEGLGVTLVPKLVASSVPGIATPSLSDPPLERNVGMAWNPQRYRSNAARTLQTFLRQAWARTLPTNSPFTSS